MTDRAEHITEAVAGHSLTDYNYRKVLATLCQLPNGGLSNPSMHNQKEMPPFGCGVYCHSCYLLKLISDEGFA